MSNVPARYLNPPMMAIGDSLYQGVRSLTIRADMMRLAAPLQVAEALGVGADFSVPQPKRPIVIDMERWIRDFPDLQAISKALAANIAYWRGMPKSPDGRAFFENISIASAEFVGLYGENAQLGLTWQKAHDWLEAKVSDDLWKQLGDLDGLVEAVQDGFDLATFVMALNTRFVLNPQGPGGPDAAKTATPVEQVALRKPSRLLVNIGSNNGLYEMGFEVDLVDFDWTGFDTLIERLDALPAEVEHIYWNGLGKPSAIANLMPVEYLAFFDTPRPGHYFDNYENRFGFTYKAAKGDIVKEMDQRIAKVNAEMQERIRSKAKTPDRFHVVDLYALLEHYDAKHDFKNTRRKVVMPNNKRLSNVFVETSPWPLPALQRGGLFGLDGMHLSGVGYGLMAQTVLAAIGKAEGVSMPRIDLAQLYEEDSLLDDPPRDWSYLLWLWLAIRKAWAAGGTPDESEGDVKAGKALMMPVAAAGRRVR
ncbi:MAG: hypothetical protein GVY13_17675 [Alphaproteobacteria bacterium]|nr:hypothetical protein [Alphaproteobacteria bacterium]